MLKAYSIYDKVGESFGPIMCLQTHGSAERMMLNTIKNETGSNISQHPADFDLYYLADFNQESGELAPLKQGAERIISGLELENLAKNQ